MPTNQFSFITALRELQPAALTVRAQAMPFNDRGQLVWDRFFPRRPVNSVRLADITSLDYRPTADRREWNAPGRRIGLVVPPYREMEMVPIESEHAIDEYEMQLLNERFGNAQTLIAEAMMSTIPQRIEMLAAANYRRLEYDVMRAWATGSIVVRNPQDSSKTYTASYNIDSSRYRVAATDWDDAGVNAYDLFLSFLEDAQEAVGPVEGAVMPRSVVNAILADAPELPNGVEMTRARLSERVAEDMGTPIRMEEMEHTIDVFADGGTAYTRTKVWPDGVVAAIPAGGSVGYTGFAPVLRAQEVAASSPGAGIDRNGVTVYDLIRNDGKELVWQAQLNAFPVPDDQMVFVEQTGIAR